jgi:O-antigen/teichoic acid export membrane protein
LEGISFRGLELAAQIALLVLTARLMEPDGRGLYALASLAVLFVSLPLGSVWTANAIELSRRSMTSGDILGASLAIAVVGGTVTAAVALAASPLLGDRWWILAIPAAVAPFILLARYEEGLYQALGDVRAVNWMVLGRVLLGIAFIAPPLVLGASDGLAIAVWGLSLVVLAAAGLPRLRRQVGTMRVPRQRAVYGRMVRVSLKLAAGNGAMLITPRVALVALAIFATTAEVGVYSVAIAIAEMLYMAVYALDLTAFPRISMSNPQDSATLTRHASRHAGLLALAGAAVVVPASMLLLDSVVGAGYADVPLLLVILIPGVVAQSIGKILFAFFAVRQARPGLITKAAILTALVNVPATFALVPVLGVWGAAAAASVAGILGNAFLTRRFLRDTGSKPRALLPGPGELRDYLGLAHTLTAKARRGAI